MKKFELVGRDTVAVENGTGGSNSNGTTAVFHQRLGGVGKGCRGWGWWLVRFCCSFGEMDFWGEGEGGLIMV
jgi:hypothetical protein